MKLKHTMEASQVLPLVKQARKAEKAGHLDLRNRFAEEIFDTKNGRKVSKDAMEVETFWDILTRSYITMVKSHGVEIHPANYTAPKTDAAVAHLWALYTFLKHA